MWSNPCAPDMSQQLSRFWMGWMDWEVPDAVNAVMLGSCFSNEMALRCREKGWDVLSNPMGMLFQPEVIAQWLDYALGNRDWDPKKQVVFDDNFYKCLAGGKVLNHAKEIDLLSDIDWVANQIQLNLKKAHVLVITLGTAYAWKYLPFQSHVGNCQRLNQLDFEQELLDVHTMESHWIKTIAAVKAFAPQLKIVFTVSPVRHERLGVMENSLSKSVLRMLCQRLSQQVDVRYFPSYEWVVDELRDYSFYKPDGCHPSEEAIDYVFDRWINSFYYE